MAGPRPTACGCRCLALPGSGCLLPGPGRLCLARPGAAWPCLTLRSPRVARRRGEWGCRCLLASLGDSSCLQAPRLDEATTRNSPLTDQSVDYSCCRLCKKQGLSFLDFLLLFDLYPRLRFRGGERHRPAPAETRLSHLGTPATPPASTPNHLASVTQAPAGAGQDEWQVKRVKLYFDPV